MRKFIVEVISSLLALAIAAWALSASSIPLTFGDWFALCVGIAIVLNTTAARK